MNFPNQSVGLLDESKFNFTQLNPSNSKQNPLPISILVQGNVLDEYFSTMLHQVNLRLLIKTPS